MRRIKLVLAVTAAVAAMSMAGAPAMADVEIDASGGSHGNGFTSIISSSEFSGFDNDGSGDFSDNFVFFSSGSSFDDIDVEGSSFHFG
jgi:hypothetical protein